MEEIEMVGAVLYASTDPIRAADSLFELLSTDPRPESARAHGFNPSWRVREAPAGFLGGSRCRQKTSGSLWPAYLPVQCCRREFVEPQARRLSDW